MNKKREKKLWILIILITIVIIVFISIIFILKKNNSSKNNNYEKLYGTWYGAYNERYSNSKLNMKSDITSNLLKIKDNNSIDICYLTDYELVCENYQYSYDGKTISIEDNELYLSGNNSVTFKDNYMILSKKIETASGSDEIKMYFELSNGDLKYNYSDNSVWMYLNAFTYDADDNKKQVDDINLSRLIFSKDSVEICNKDNKCNNVNYKVNDNNLVIDENEYFNGEFNIKYTEMYMILEKTLENGNRNIYYFGKPVG